jgi:hypothetical protein
MGDLPGKDNRQTAEICNFLPESPRPRTLLCRTIRFRPSDVDLPDVILYDSTA